MDENSEEQQNNFNQNLDSENQENYNREEGDNNEQLEGNENQLEAMNRNPNVQGQNPLMKFIYNKNQNVVEEKSNQILSCLDKYKESFGKYFNVELNDIKLKLKGALIPFNKSFYQSIDINADLYGPFWIFTTIIFLIALIGNFSAYYHAEDKKNLSTS